MPKITDFNLNSPQGEDRTEEVLSDNWLLVVVHQVDGTERAAYNELKQLLAEADKLGIKSLAVSSDAANLEGFLTDVQMDVPHVYADATVLKTMIRSNPGVILMQEGTIRGKWHFNDTPEIAAVEERLK